MNAPFAPQTLDDGNAALIPFERAINHYSREWQAIAAHASEPNSFAEHWFVAASLRHLSPPDDARILIVRDEGQLIGMMPVFVSARYGRMPVRHVQNWSHYHSFYGAPLVRRSFEPFFWARALELLDAEPDYGSLLHVTGLDPDGRLAQTLLAARRGAAIVHRTRRALLASDLSPQDYYETTVRKKKRKEISRLRARLAELGPVAGVRLRPGDAVAPWIDDFLTLEASGWKGREGAALANETATTAFLRDALEAAHAIGNLEMIRLDLAGRPIAMLVNFLCPPGSYSFKIAFDEDYARFSPGVLVQIENLDILSRRDIAWMDSCAVEGHPMIESLWGQRRDIVRISVPLGGWRRHATFAMCRTLESASALVRRAA